MRRFLLFILLGLVLLLAAAVANTLRTGGVPPAPARVSVTVDDDAVVAHLAGAVRFRTVSNQEGGGDPAAFEAFHEFLQQTYPLSHERLTREIVGGLSLLYTWRGSDDSKPPVVLMGHQDVVPVVPGTEPKWTHEPFGGAIADGFIWGRGTLDDKATVVAVFEAVEQLLAEGFQPDRTVYLAFGHDEELGGREGAQAIATLYRERKLGAPALVLDEGGAVLDGTFPGVPGSVALVGVAEKGYLSLELSVEGEGGHSSAPPFTTHIGRLARAISTLESNQFSAHLAGPPLAMLERLAPAMPFSRRLALTNLWLFRPLVSRRLLAEPQTAAMLRTTTAPTILQAGTKDNVLPPKATAVINFRISPGETVESVTARVSEVVADPNVQMRPIGFRTDPSPVSDYAGAGYTLVERSIQETLGREVPVVAPYLVMGGTDARYWSGLSNQVFRFNPFPVEADVLTRAHGTNERISTAGFVNGVKYYIQLLRNAKML